MLLMYSILLLCMMSTFTWGTLGIQYFDANTDVIILLLLLSASPPLQTFPMLAVEKILMVALQEMWHPVFLVLDTWNLSLVKTHHFTKLPTSPIYHQDSGRQNQLLWSRSGAFKPSNESTPELARLSPLTGRTGAD